MGWTYVLDREATPEPYYRLRVRAGLHRLDGNTRPYWSITGELVNLRRVGRYSDGIEACGCMHDEILAHWPELEPVVALHLADDRGEPMHAGANAAYWLGLSVWSDGSPMVPSSGAGAGELETGPEGLDWAPEGLARSWRVPVDRARVLRARIMAAGETREERVADVAAVVDYLRVQWAGEADAARELLEGLGARECHGWKS